MDPFGDLDAKMESDMLRKKRRDDFLKLLGKHPKTEADRDAIGKARRTDPFLNAVFLFKDYYELKKMSGRTAAQDAQIATIETQYPTIATVYNNAKLKSMLTGAGRRKGLSRRKTNGGRRRRTARRHS
jgi:hypothetical protein